MPERFDLAVVGGGPAGCAAAITATRRGQRVLLVERGRYPRHKVCGEFVSAESLGLLENLLGSTNVLVARAPRIQRTRVFLPGGNFDAPIAPPAVSIARFDLDQALWKAAVAAGVDARQDCGACAITPAYDGGYTLLGEGLSCACDRVVHAGGRRAQFSGGRFVGLKAHFRTAEPLDSVDLYFSPNGYCGVQPLGNGLLNVCAMVAADAVKTAGPDRMSAALALHPALRAQPWQQVTETFATAALAFGDPEPVQDGCICAGDRAGFIDPFLGDGISLALQSGVLAGDISDCATYAAEYRRRFLPVFRRAARLRKLLGAPAALQKTALLLMKWPGVAAAVVDRTRARARDACLLRRD